MNGIRGAAALLLAALVASPSVAQQTFHCESTEGRAQARIVGGQQASIEDWPWQVMLILTKSPPMTRPFDMRRLDYLAEVDSDRRPLPVQRYRRKKSVVRRSRIG